MSKCTWGMSGQVKQREAMPNHTGYTTPLGKDELAF